MMSAEMTLWVLRVVSAVLLLLFMARVALLLWEGRAGVVVEVEPSRRVLGHLIPVNGDGMRDSALPTYPLLPLTSLGRAAGNTVTVEDTFASGEHALLALRNGVWWLEDRKSRNGTVLNGVPITQPVIVTEGDVIGIGQRRYRLELEA